jgi:uncharacterized protein with ParB-like and HNH nuclease domain
MRTSQTNRLNPETVVNGEANNIQDLFSCNYLIPDYQRDYVWKTKTIEQLIGDLIHHYQRITVNENFKQQGLSGYFLGAMVVIPKDKVMQEVVDGQQRLTTLTLVAAALCELLKRLVPDSHDKKYGYLQLLQGITAVFPSGKASARISFSDQMFNEFYAGIVATPLTRKEKTKFVSQHIYRARLKNKNSSFYIAASGLWAIYRKIYSFLRELHGVDRKEKRISRLITFIELFLECVVILKIEAKTYESAYNIFESLNNRGIPLSQADLIKNELLKLSLSDDDRDVLIENWNLSKSIIEDTELKFTDFIHYSWLSRFGHIKSAALLSGLKKKIESSDLTTVIYSDYLREDAEAFRALFLEQPVSWPLNLKEKLLDIKNVFGIKFAYPFTFSAHRKYSNNIFKFNELMDLLSNFVFRFMKVGEGSVESLADVMAECSQLINSGKDISEIAHKFKSLSSDNSFVEDFKDYSTNNAKLCYYIVYCFEKYKLNGTMPLPHGVEQHLEHIMPKRPTEVFWPHAFQLKASSSIDYSDLIWRIGNLVPLPGAVNTSLKNKSIQDKLNGYKKTNLISPSQVELYLEDGEWSAASIANRQDALAAEAPKVWPL